MKLRLIDTPFGYPTDGLWLFAQLLRADVMARRGICSYENSLWNIADKLVQARLAAQAVTA